MEKNETWFVLGNGIEIDTQEINFLPSLKINKIKDSLSVFDLAAAGSKGFREWAMLEPISTSCQFEIVSGDLEINTGYDTLNRAWLLNTLLVLRKKLKISSVACCSYSWNEIAGFQQRSSGNDLQLPPFKGNLLDFYTQIIQLPKIENRKVEGTDVEWIKNHFEIANSLASKYEKFRFALETINSWRYAKDIKSALAIIWAAIESILGVSSEIVFRISLNIASVLVAKGEERLNKFNQIRKLYDLRSKVVHGSELKPEQTAMAVEESFLLLSDLVVNMIEKNRILTKSDFEKAVFY